MAAKLENLVAKVILIILLLLLTTVKDNTHYRIQGVYVPSGLSLGLIFSISGSFFGGGMAKITGSRPRLWDWHPRLGNPGSATDTACDIDNVGDHSSWTITSKSDKTETQHLHS